MTDAAARPQRARRTPMTAPEMPEPEPQAEPAVNGNGADHVGPARIARKPFGARQERLDSAPIPGFYAYWFNATPGRIERAKEAGYDHVTDSEGKPVKKVVGTMEGGGPLLAYRMKLPIDWYREDMEAKEAPRKEVDKQMRTGGKDGGYAAAGRPGYTDAKASAEMSAEGRQKFNLPPPQK